MAVQNFGSGGGGFQLSPGVNISEIDLTTVTPAVDTTVGAFAGVFRWGPVNERVLVTSENDLVRKFGKPTNINPETFFTAANFLGYSNSLYVVRAADTTTQFAAAGGETLFANVIISGTFSSNSDVGAGNNPARILGNNTLFTTQLVVGDILRSSSNTLGTVASISNNTVLFLTSNATSTVTFESNAALWKVVKSATRTIYNNDDFDNKEAELASTGANFIARWPGELGNSLKVSRCDSVTQFSSTANLVSLTYTISANTGAGDAEGNTAPFDGPSTGFVMNIGSLQGVFTLDGGANSSGYGVFDAATNCTELQTIANAIADKYTVGDYIVVGSGTAGTGATQALKIASKSSVLVSNSSGVNTGIVSFTITFDQPLKLAAPVNTTNITRYWEYYTQVDGAPGRSTYVSVNGDTAAQLADANTQLDEVHVVVVDEDGGFTGSPGTILEVWQGLSRATDAKNSDGTTNYYKTVINDQSQYIWVGADRTGTPSNTSIAIISANNATSPTPLTVSLDGGVDKSETDIAFSAIVTAYDKFVSPEDVDISLVLAGSARGGTNGEQLPNYLIDNIAEVRKDCVVFVSPQKADVVNAATPETNVVAFRNSVRSTSYAVMDSGYKQMYDKYNDLYRWVPLNGDIAGLCVRTDNTRDPWFSPAGTSRGQVKNVIKLAFNPNLAQRDLLYKNGVNPVISQQGQGTILFGDKTLLSKPSAFDRINVRRLFIVLEKAISTAAKSFLFEFNDEFTRTQFRNLVEPYLRDVQGRRGIYDFKVVCDETNNTPEIVDSNKFVGDIYIKPARSINYIQLNFVAVRSGIEFSEIVG